MRKPLGVESADPIHVCYTAPLALLLRVTLLRTATIHEEERSTPIPRPVASMRQRPSVPDVRSQGAITQQEARGPSPAPQGHGTFGPSLFSLPQLRPSPAPSLLL